MRIVRTAAFSAPAGRRKASEDAVLSDPHVPVYAVADGAGGPEAAQHALDIVKREGPALRERLSKIAADPSSSNRVALTRTFEAIFTEASQRVAEMGAGRLASTLVVATFSGRFCWVAHVGNSRAYLFRATELSGLTTDHTVAMVQLLQGEISRDDYETSVNRKRLTQALGTTSHPSVDIAELRLLPGDRILLCSDGLTTALTDLEIAGQLSEGDVGSLPRRLVKAASETGIPDDVSAVVVEVGGEEGDASAEEELTAPSDSADVAVAMRQVFLFRGLAEAERLLIAPFLEEIVVEAGRALCTEGEAGDDFYVIVSGKLRISRGSTHLVDIGPGGHLGELALVRSGPRTATARAVQRSRVFALSRERFLEIVRRKPLLAARLTLALLQTMGERLVDLTERLDRAQK